MNVSQELATWLHLYNNGLSLQKRYIFSVVERRLPSYSNRSVNGQPSGATKAFVRAAALRKHLKVHRNDDQFSDAEEEGSEQSSAGGGRASESSGGATDSESEAAPSSSTKSAPSTATDNLSELFGTISLVCREQFDIIRKVFPSSTVARVTRLLIQRIFNDPAFGIQSRVEMVLRPKPPKPALPLGDYLDALVTVREKLSGLTLILSEYCIYCTSTYKQMQAKSERMNLQGAPSGLFSASSGNEPGGLSTDEDKRLSMEHLKSVSEINEFLGEQVRT